MPSKVLAKYLSKYGGISDFHLYPLRMLKKKFQVEKVLYPGSWIHLTPSLVFPYVVYVDSIAKMKLMFNDLELTEYIKTHSEVKGKPFFKFYQKDFREGLPEEKESFDLLISLSSGLVSQHCGSYLKKNGLLFVNNEHYDAINAFVDDNFLPVGIFTSYRKLLLTKESIQEHFITKNDELISSEMVLENSKRPPSKAKFKLKKKAPFYLFRRI